MVIVAYYQNAGRQETLRYESCFTNRKAMAFIRALPMTDEPQELWRVLPPKGQYRRHPNQDEFGGIYGARVGEQTAHGYVIKQAIKFQ